MFKEKVPHKNASLATTIPVDPHFCTRVGPECCATGAAFDCCCGQFVEAKPRSQKAIDTSDPVEEHEAKQMLNHTVPQLPHYCNDTGKHCCAADAPFECCCSMFKEKPSSRTVRQRGEVMAMKMKRFANSYFGHDKAHEKMARAEIKAAGKVSFKAKTASHQVKSTSSQSETITEQALNVLNNIKTFEGDAAHQSVPAQATARTQSHAKTAPSAKKAAAKSTAGKRGKAANAKESGRMLRSDERRELEEDVQRKSSTSTTTLQMPAKVRAVQKIAAQVFGQQSERKMSDSVLRKQLAKEADTLTDSSMDAIERDAMQELHDDSKVRVCCCVCPLE